MNRIGLLLIVGALVSAIFIGTAAAQNPSERVTKPYPNFEVEVLVNGRPLSPYYERGRIYVEALKGAEYELRLRNSSPDRVAVALFVDGLNTIDASRTSAWNASKWVIEPYQTITISGWQMSSERARRFYFTNERDSYAAKLGQRRSRSRPRARETSSTPPASGVTTAGRWSSSASTRTSSACTASTCSSPTGSPRSKNTTSSASTAPEVFGSNRYRSVGPSRC